MYDEEYCTAFQPFLPPSGFKHCPFQPSKHIEKCGREHIIAVVSFQKREYTAYSYDYEWAFDTHTNHKPFIRKVKQNDLNNKLSLALLRYLCAMHWNGMTWLPALVLKSSITPLRTPTLTEAPSEARETAFWVQFGRPPSTRPLNAFFRTASMS